MKILVRVIGGLLTVVIVLLLAQAIASETGEVIVLHTTDAKGQDVTTRVWIVDHDGAPWLRAGLPTSAWYVRLAAQPMIQVQRGDTVTDYIAVPVPEERAMINEAMRSKYGWRDAMIGVLIGGRERAIAIRLDRHNLGGEERRLGH